MRTNHMRSSTNELVLRGTLHPQKGGLRKSKRMILWFLFGMACSNEYPVSVISYPEGAQVFLGQQEKEDLIVETSLLCEATPCEILLPRGRVVLVLQKEGYLRRVSSFAVPTSEFVQIRLWKGETELSLSTDEHEVRVSLDNKPWGLTPVSQKVAMGSHLIEIDDPCYQETSQNVMLDELHQAVTLIAEEKKIHRKLTLLDEHGILLDTQEKIFSVCDQYVQFTTENKSVRQFIPSSKREEGELAFTLYPSVYLGAGYEARLLPAGQFWMGSPENEEFRESDEQLHLVELTREIYMMTKEVNQQLYRRVMKNNPSEKEYEGRNLVASLLPVQNMSWLDVILFSNRLNQQEGREECYVIEGLNVTWPKEQACTGWRLPTEAEWEFAARGTTANTRSLTTSGTVLPTEDVVYSQTSELAEVCKFANIADVSAAIFNWEWLHFPCTDGFAAVAPGGSLAANSFGLYDLSGNIYEWVWDWQAQYPNESIDPIGPKEGQYRGSRGGGWTNSPRRARIANREGLLPENQGNDLGFRLVRTVQ